MAVKWAVANGNWNAGTTWNDGVVPTADDDVFLNGNTITLPNSAYTAVAQTISNGYCEQTGGSGGSITGGRQQTITLYNDTSLTAVVRYITANVICEGTPISTGGNHIRLVVFGNVLCNSQLTDNSTSYHRGVHITGNVIANSFLVGNGSVQELIVTGNCEISSRPTYSTSAYFQCVGVVNANVSFSEDTIIANVINCNTNALITVNTATINGSISYKSTENTMGLHHSTLNILNPDTFTWKDVTEPRSNPFIIVTDAEMNNRQQYPSEDEVKEGTEYVWGEKVGTYQQPPEAVVLKGYRYDNYTKEGTLENENIVGCVTPEDVRKDVPLVGMGVVGTLVVPNVDDVREGVIFDNGSVGTLIVEGGGDRLRIADFGYYTNAQSDTYIVDLTEQDKPKFAVAEERVLIEMFPDLDLENIPEKYFDDLFVKYLKYRLIVEYYRTAGINSTFTPGEPTTEIVNYQNVRNEVWLNSANIYLKAWAKKYPESITKPRRILL